MFILFRKAKEFSLPVFFQFWKSSVFLSWILNSYQFICIYILPAFTLSLDLALFSWCAKNAKAKLDFPIRLCAFIQPTNVLRKKNNEYQQRHYTKQKGENICFTYDSNAHVCGSVDVYVSCIVININQSEFVHQNDLKAFWWWLYST